MFIALIQAPTFSQWHTKTHTDSNRCHSERDCHRSTATQLWNADMSSSNHTRAFVQCCHGKHTVASSWTLLSDHVKLLENTIFFKWHWILISWMLFEFFGFLSALKKWYSCTHGPTYLTLMNDELSCVIAVSAEWK